MSSKGKYATATERRRFVWARIIWPLVIDLGEPVFTLEQYRKKRDEVCTVENMQAASRGLASLVQKGVLVKENNLYSLHYRLIPYLRVNITCDYASAIHETSIVS